MVVQALPINLLNRLAKTIFEKQHCFSLKGFAKLIFLIDWHI